MVNRKTFVENELHIVNKESVQVPFTQNYVQNKLDEVRERLKRENKPIWILVLKARQEGCSAKVEADWLTDCATTKNVNAVVISHEKESTKRLLRRVHYYIETANLKIETEKSSEYEISFPETNSWFYIGTAGSRAFGRGDTIHRVHLSEWAFYQDDTVVDGIFQSVPLTGEVVAESTANGFGNRFQIEWDRATKGESKFYPLFFSWADNPEYQIKNTILNEDELTDEEKILLKAHRLTVPQIAWRREKMKEFNTKEAFAQEYPLTPEEAFIFTGTPAFDQLALKSYRTQTPLIGMFKDTGTDVVFEENEKGWWRKWENPEPGIEYYGFLDPSEGLDPEERGDPDYSAIEFIDQECNQAAELQQRLTPAESARQLALAGRYYNRAFIGWELNNSGHAVSVTIKDLYAQARTFKPPNETKQYGWRTSQKTRKILVDSLAEMICEHDLTIQSQWAVMEHMSFRLNADGKFEAQSGAHDDLVIAMGGAIQMWRTRPAKYVSAVREHLRKEKKVKHNPYFHHE